MTTPLFSSFADWSEAWLELALFTGPTVDDPERRIDALLALWRAEIPGQWKRPVDPRLADPERRYQRTHRSGAPKPGSESELEWEILAPDPQQVMTTVIGGRLIDGVNAVPLARDSAGGRRGNVEADMLLVTSQPERRLWLVEAKTKANNAWYAAIENLRQLKLFQASPTAQRILPRPERPAGTLCVSPLVVAPREFFTAPGAKSNAIEPTRQLEKSIASALGVQLRLALWNKERRAIVEIPPTTVTGPSLTR